MPQTNPSAVSGNLLSPTNSPRERFDLVNVSLAAFVALASGWVYWLTVQPTVSFWDCGEFIATSYILGIPHPPGSPLFILIGRLFSVIPWAADIGLRVNMISVLSSAATAMFGYLVVARMIKMWYQRTEWNFTTRLISYVGGLTGAFFLAFSRTNWGNAVEAEVYGLTMMLNVAIFWLCLLFYESRGKPKSFRYLALALYLGMLGVGIHMAAFLVIPVAAIFFVIKKDADELNWVYLCSFFVIELALITLLSFGGVSNGYNIFLVISIVLFAALAIKLFHNMNIPWVVALASVAGIMVGFWPFIYGLIGATAFALIYGRIVPRSSWRSALVIIAMALMGFSVNLFIPVRSAVNPRIDENNPSKDFQTFVDFLERKQYGSVSMTARMFNRRGLFENQFGRHPHMGFWSYFEEQYSHGRAAFVPFFLLGALGIYFMMRRRLEVGYPFFIMCLLGSVGLILYMNFADGIMYNKATNDAYMEVRNRDYFFTTAFIFFGLAIGLGVAALMEMVRIYVSQPMRKTAVMATSALGFLSLIPLQHNWFVNDRSNNYLPYDYADTIIQTIPENGIVFTSGDNDTFPLWCLQEAYRVRRDVKVVNLSLLNTDWYVDQMKNRFGVPVPLSDSQIVWHRIKRPDGRIENRPLLMFDDRARQRRTYMTATYFNNRVVKVQDMMVDEISIAAGFKNVCFTAEPYAESPLGLRERKESVGVVNILTLNPKQRMIDVDKSYDLYMNQYRIRGLNDPNIYKDDNATGVLVSYGFGAVRVFNELIKLEEISGQIKAMEDLKKNSAQTESIQLRLDTLYASMNGASADDSALFSRRATALMDSMIVRYPEFWMNYVLMSDYYRSKNDSARGLQYLLDGEKNIAVFHEKSPDIANYAQDLGLMKHEIAKKMGAADDQDRYAKAGELLWEGFYINMNSGMAYQKLLQYLYDRRQSSEIARASKLHAQYSINYYNNPSVKRIVDQSGGIILP